MDKNTLAKLNVVCLLLKHKEEESKSIKDGNYADEIQYLISHNRRNKFIFNLCDTLKGNTLLLYQMVEKHGMVLYQLCQKLDRDLHFVYGGVDAQEREEVRRLTEKSDKSLIIELLMEHFLLVLILRILTMLYLHHQVNQELEYYNPLVED